MSLITLLPDLPGCSVEQVSQTEEAILITACATPSSSCCPDCQQLLRVRRFRCSNPKCRRKTFAERFPHLVAPRAQRTCSVRDLLRAIGEVMGGEVCARLSQKLAMKCSPATVLRLVRQSPLPSSARVPVVGVDEWAWRKGQRYGTLLVDLEKQRPIDLLADATAESFALWLQAHPSVEIVSRDRGTRLGLMEPPVERRKPFRLLIAGIFCTILVRPWRRS